MENLSKAYEVACRRLYCLGKLLAKGNADPHDEASYHRIAKQVCSIRAKLHKQIALDMAA